ncbi:MULTISPECIES: thiol reductant ABC exporter subunit CydC [Luteimonas]|uniref:thiol reductant ABC exporter subunit CydC n=1 Tax=Luteimonas TaxID=83614 RepID=UPI000C7C32C6|nr:MULTISPECIES: thiol reductant ABC exporter subunit CydC [Luteimonas]
MNLPADRITSTRALLRRHRGRVALAVGLLLVTMAAGLGLLGVSGGFLTAAALTFGTLGTFNFFTPSAGIRGLTLARIVSRYLEKLAGHDTMLRIARDLRTWFFARALRLSPGQLGRLRTGDLLARLTGDIDAVDGLLLRATGPLFALIGIGVVAVGAAVWLHPPTGSFLALVGIAAAIAVSWVVARGRAAAEHARTQQRAQLRARLHELYEGQADLVALGAAGAWLDAVAGDSRVLGEADRVRRRQLADGQAVHGIIAACGLLGVLWIAAGATAAGTLSGPRAAALFFMTVGLLELWAAAGLAWQALLSARASIARLDAVAGTEPSVRDPDAPVAAPAHGDLVFDGVGFGWADGGRTLLDGLDFSLAAGERVAISGDSGAGKSTLSALLLRSADPRAGAVTFGGVALRAMRQQDWHARIGWLPQNAPVFAGSVRDNLAFGAAEADDAALWAMLARVRLKGWAERIGGLEAWVGENGATMSAGQARRLALARALLRDAPLIVLDEPTEGLDHDTADVLLRDLPALLDGRSLLLITHGVLPPGLVHRHLWLRDGRLHAAPPG